MPCPYGGVFHSFPYPCQQEMVFPSPVRQYGGGLGRGPKSPAYPPALMRDRAAELVEEALVLLVFLAARPVGLEGRSQLLE